MLLIRTVNAFIVIEIIISFNDAVSYWLGLFAAVLSDFMSSLIFVIVNVRLMVQS